MNIYAETPRILRETTAGYTTFEVVDEMFHNRELECVGEVSSGLALYDVMQAISCPIRTVCLGKAASMGAILFAAGDKREILPHGEVMIHDPLIYRGVGGSALSVQETSRQLLKTRQTLGDILARHTGKSRQEIYRKTAKNTWFSAEEAVSFGLADRVINKL